MNEENIEYLKKYLPKESNYQEALERLKNGEPVQYIVGDVNFYGNIIKVNKNVLIPRRETEELVEKTTAYIQKYLPVQNKILDIGTGSGCIAITLKKLLPSSEITAIDISKKALKIAKSNASLNKVEINFKESNLFQNIKDKYNCIISNPPYISKKEKIMDIVKNNEPHIALYAKENGLYFYQKILSESLNYLTTKSIIAFEIGETQAQEIIQIAKKYFPKAKVILEQDLQHLDRFIFIINE